VAVTSERWDIAALRAGVSVTAVFAAPFLIAARIVADRDGDSSLPVLLILVSLAGFVIGAGVAAWLQKRRTPLTHGIVTAVGTYVVVQAVFVTVKLVRGSEVRWVAIFFNLTVTLLAGAMGGLLGATLQKRGLEPRQ
jgi:putative membrane protein (TIGR04086 family)